MRKVLIRVDSGSHMGLGHLMRCRNLALGFKKLNCEVSFITRLHFGHSAHLINKDFAVHTLNSEIKAPLDQKALLNYGDWLGTSYETEIQETADYIRAQNGFDLVVLDHYSLDARFEKSLRVDNILVIDDLQTRKHSCNFLLNQNQSGSLPTYEKLNLRKQCTYFLGPKYALLNTDFKNHRPKDFQAIRKVSRILVSFGGSDITNETLKVVQAYLGIKDIFDIKVILSASHPNFPEVKELSKGSKPFELVEFIQDMAAEIVNADVCFGAAGSSSWERACLGAPCFTIIVADNQSSIIDTLTITKSTLPVGDGRRTTLYEWGAVFKKLKQIKELNTVAANNYNLCKGEGVSLISKTILNAIK